LQPFASVESREPVLEALDLLDERGLTVEHEASSDTACEIISIETLRRHRQLVRMREWLVAQMPWQRDIVQKVSQRIRAA